MVNAYFLSTSPESRATEKGKRPSYLSGTPSPKKLRLETDDHEGKYYAAFSRRVNSHKSKYFLKQIEAETRHVLIQSTAYECIRVTFG